MVSPTFLVVDERTKSSFEEIPVIDFSQATNPDPVVRRELADLIRDACINVGFFYISHHGIPDEVLSGALAAGKRYFELPLSEKLKLDIHKSNNYKGYTALLGENTDVNGRGDLHEGFDLGWEPESDTPEKEQQTVSGDGSEMSGGNVWPDPEVLQGNSFRDPVLAYYRAAVRLGHLLFPLFALALDLPEDFFEDKTQNSAAIMRLLHYPPQSPAEVDADGRVIGIGAHTDYECFTILWQDDVGGLQVQNADGRWINAVPIPGTLVLNLGDQFARWTNDVFKSTMHRAINRTGRRRYSIPLFFGTDYDVLLEPLPGCVTPGSTPKYEIVTAGQYVKSRLEATYAHSVAD